MTSAFLFDMLYSDNTTARTIPALLGYGAFMAALLGTFKFTGGSLFGYKKDPEVDEFERREALRTTYRKPMEQTLAELGEGRGAIIPLTPMKLIAGEFF